ncbi:MAG TPA: hypothetical protein VN673_00150 [Clostridia bacterium]|nr:hypothetical protein [Clostridia bacterium]
MREDNEQSAPVLETRRVLPRALRPVEAWVSVALCYGGAAVPVFSGSTGTASVTGHGVMLALLVIGFAAGVNVLVGKTSPWAKGAAFIPVLVCGGKLFMSCIAGTQS